MSRIVRRVDAGTMERWTPPGLGSSAQAMDDPVPLPSQSEEGFEAGFAKGYEEGQAAALQESRASLDRLAAIARSVIRPFEMFDENLEDELCRLCIAIARQVVRRELHTDPDHVAAILREARKSLGSITGTLCIGVHPDDAPLIRRMFTDHGDLSGVQVDEDPSMGRGGCTLATDTSFVDATVETRIARIAVQLLGDERDVAEAPVRAEAAS